MESIGIGIHDSHSTELQTRAKAELTHGRTARMVLLRPAPLLRSVRRVLITRRPRIRGRVFRPRGFRRIGIGRLRGRPLGGFRRGYRLG